MNAYTATVVGRLPGSVGHAPATAAPVRAAPRVRTALTWALGALWLLDAALQFQPYMFTRAVPDDVIAPAGAGSPAWIAATVSWAAHLMSGHIVVFNTLFAVVQLLIAIGLFIPATVRPALAGSIVWSVLVWWLGEGFGGLLAGPVSPLMGLPGAVLLYALIALLVWPRRHRPRPRPGPRPPTSVAGAGLLGSRGAAGAWVALWALFAYEALRSGNRRPNGLRDVIAGMADGEPRWIASINTSAARAFADHGGAYSIILAALCAFIALRVLVPRLTRTGIALAITLALAIWVIGEDFGEIATGTSTDPNSGIPLAILALCYWPFTRSRGERRIVVTLDTSQPGPTAASSSL
jgi:hypothetical protein